MEEKTSTGQSFIDSLKSKSIIFVLILVLATGAVCSYFYQNSPQHAIAINDFQKEIFVKEKQAAKTIDAMNEIIIHSSVDSLIHYPFADTDIS